MQKHLDDLLRQTGLVPEWKDLLRDLDRLAQARIRHRCPTGSCAPPLLPP